MINKIEFNLAILETLKQYVYVFKENKILDKKKILENYQLFQKHFKDVI